MKKNIFEKKSEFKCDRILKEIQFKITTFKQNKITFKRKSC